MQVHIVWFVMLLEHAKFLTKKPINICWRNAANNLHKRTENWFTLQCDTSAAQAIPPTVFPQKICKYCRENAPFGIENERRNSCGECQEECGSWKLLAAEICKFNSMAKNFSWQIKRGGKTDSQTGRETGGQVSRQRDRGIDKEWETGVISLSVAMIFDYFMYNTYIFLFTMVSNWLEKTNVGFPASVVCVWVCVLSSIETTWKPTNHNFLTANHVIFFYYFLHFISDFPLGCMWKVFPFICCAFNEYKKSFALQHNIIQIDGHFYLWNLCGIL